MVLLNIGGKEFVIGRSTCYEFGFFSSFKDDQSNMIDRDPLCFPIIQHHLRGYDFQHSLVERIFASSKLTPSEFYYMLLNDIDYYQLPELKLELCDYLYMEHPRLVPKGYEKERDEKIKEELLQELEENKEKVKSTTLLEDYPELQRCFSIDKGSREYKVREANKILQFYLNLQVFIAFCCTLLRSIFGYVMPRQEVGKSIIELRKFPKVWLFAYRMVARFQTTFNNQVYDPFMSFFND